MLVFEYFSDTGTGNRCEDQGPTAKLDSSTGGRGEGKTIQDQDLGKQNLGEEGGGGGESIEFEKSEYKSITISIPIYPIPLHTSSIPNPPCPFAFPPIDLIPSVAMSELSPRRLQRLQSQTTKKSRAHRCGTRLEPCQNFSWLWHLACFFLENRQDLGDTEREPGGCVRRARAASNDQCTGNHAGLALAEKFLGSVLRVDG